MFKDITIGQYIPGKSPLHRLNPVVKIIFAVAYITVLFLIDKPIPYFIFTLYTLTLIIISGINIKIILKGIRPMLWIFILTAVLNVFMTPGETIWSVPVFSWSLKITKEGIYTGAMITVRLLYLITGTSLLTLTTSPLRLTDGIEKLLSPLRKIKVPASEIAMMMTIAIRFIPTLAEETDKIMKAQTARGADFQSGNIIKRAKAMVPLLVPLFISAFRRADELATAMEARCYVSGAKRTRMKEIRFTFLDIRAIIIFSIACAALITTQYWIYL